MLDNFGEWETSLSPESEGGGAARQETAKRNVIVLKWLLTEVKKRGKHENAKVWPHNLLTMAGSLVEEALMTQIEPGGKQSGTESFLWFAKPGISSLEIPTLWSVKQFHQTSHCNPWAKPEMIIHW